MVPITDYSRFSFYVKYIYFYSLLIILFLSLFCQNDTPIVEQNRNDHILSILTSFDKITIVSFKHSIKVELLTQNVHQNVANLTNLLEILGFPIPQHTALLVCLVMAHPTISQYSSDLHQLLLDNLGLTNNLLLYSLIKHVDIILWNNIYLY